MHNLAAFSMADMVACGDALRAAAAGAKSMEEAGRGMVRRLYDILGDGAGGHGAALVRLYKTHAYGDLGPELKAFADGVLSNEPRTAATKCLTLLATAGDHPAWNDRKTSTGHQAIPLPSAKVVERLPMVAQLIRQLGIDVSALVEPSEHVILDVDQKAYNVFHVPQAAGSPYVPAQDGFVIPNRIASVVGFGGLLPTGDLYAFILFTKVPVPEETAQLFRTITLSAKMALLPFMRGPIFAPEAK